MEATQRPLAVEFGPFCLDLGTGELLRAGQKFRLQEQSFQVLAALVTHPGEVVSRDELRKRLWSDDTFVDFDVGLNNAVKRLREALGDSAERPRYIETLPRRGYRFVAALKPPSGPALSPAPAPTAAQVSVRPVPHDLAATESAAARFSRRFWLVLVGLFLMFSATGTAIWWRRSHAPKILSIAVLPLRNLSSDSTQDYFADGVTDAITTELAQVSALRVEASAAVSQYKGSSIRPAQIATTLRTDALLEGTVERQGDRVHINLRLLNSSGDKYLWAQSYDRSMDDVLSLESAVARQVAAQVRATLYPSEKLRLSRDLFVDPAAYDSIYRRDTMLST